nr:protein NONRESPONDING TO OXYLIPINS 2, mitochondrial-like [Aegilops tauschii subsp. strangulata]
MLLLSRNRAAASAARSALRPAPLAGRSLGSALPSRSPVPAARAIRRAAALETLLPLHTAVASARLRSCIAVDSACWSPLSLGRPLSTC